MHRNATLRPSLPSLAVDLYRAEELSGFSRSTLRRAISSGELRAARAGTAVRIRVADLDAWLMKIADSDKPGVAPASVPIMDQPTAAADARP